MLKTVGKNTAKASFIRRTRSSPYTGFGGVATNHIFFKIINLNKIIAFRFFAAGEGDPSLDTYPEVYYLPRLGPSPSEGVAFARIRCRSLHQN